MSSERRHSGRIRLSHVCYIRIEPDNGAILVSLSEDGLCFQAAEPVRDAGQMRFWFSCPINGRVEARAELEWLDETKKRGGVRFLDLTTDARQYVRNLLARSAEKFRPRSDLSPLSASRGAQQLQTAAMPHPGGLQHQSIPTVSSPPRGISSPKPRVANSSHFSDAGERSPLRSPWLCEPSKVEVTNCVPQQQWAQRRRKRYLGGFFTGVALSVLGFIGLLGVPPYEQQIGKFLLARRLISQQQKASEVQSNPPTKGLSSAIGGSAAIALAHTEVATSLDQSSAGDTIRPSSLDKTDIPSAAATVEAGSENKQATEPGNYELAMAERYLTSSKSRNSRTAAQWLWAAIEKGNVRAEVALSDLYIAGDGVEKNCKQARTLLEAAATKGNASAAERLQDDKYGSCTIGAWSPR